MPEQHTPPVSNLVDLVRWRADSPGGDAAYLFLDGAEVASRLAYFALERRARSIAAVLQERGARGERALLLYPPGQHYVEGFFGCLFGGVIPVPAYPPNLARPERTLPRLLEIIRDSGATVLLTVAPIRAQSEALSGLAPELAALDWVSTDDIDADAERWKPWAPGPDDLAFLQYTSGSTRSPRGVLVSHQNLLHNSAQIHDRFGHSPASQGLTWLPPYHDMGLIGGILQPLYGGFPVAVMSPFDFMRNPRVWLEAITRFGANTSGGPNFAFDLCVRRVPPERREGLDLSTWSLAFCGAEPVRPETARRFIDAFAPYGFDPGAFFPCYGLAEGTLIVSGGPRGQGLSIRESDSSLPWAAAGEEDPERLREFVTSGAPVDGQEVLIVDPETTTRCPAGVLGEVWVNGPSVCGGYWEREEESEATFRAKLADEPGRCFLRTGDLGCIVDGELLVAGRSKEAFSINGRNHFPHDIEQTVETTSASIRPGCIAAFALERKSRLAPIVVIELDPGAEREAATLGGGIASGIRKAVLADHGIRIDSVVIVTRSTIPKTSSGKVRRLDCARRLGAGELPTLFVDSLERGSLKLTSTSAAP